MFRLAVVSAIFALSFAVALNTELDGEWNMYKFTYKKDYGAEEAKRRVIWEKNVRFIQTHNLQADRGVHTFTVGMNQFGDMTVEEFSKVMNGYIMSSVTHNNATYMSPSNSQLPESVDWRKEGYVTEMKDQGQCGSCYTFSATGSVEGQHFKKTGELVSLSEQNLVDCTRLIGNLGCDGGMMRLCFEYIKFNSGIDTETSYPYESGRGQDNFRCRYIPDNKGSAVKDWAAIQYQSEADLQSAVATVGPVSVAIDATHQSFQFYRSGVYYEPRCSSDILDHAVLAVGYGTEDGSDYWLVKNSWAESWGNKGYIQMSRNRENNCGIATQASFPIL